MADSLSSADGRFPLAIATFNLGKAAELARLLGHRFVVTPLPPSGDAPPETGSSFAENSRLKAEWAFGLMNGEAAVLADDSGLEVEALGGLPGVWSARYAGEGSTDRQNVVKLTSEMSGKKNRRARFVCALTLVLPEGVQTRSGEHVLSVTGLVEGQVEAAPRGRRGFGYDPVFKPRGWRHTFGEVEESQKDAVSHRGTAVRRLVALLEREGVISSG